MRVHTHTHTHTHTQALSRNNLDSIFAQKNNKINKENIEVSLYKNV